MVERFTERARRAMALATDEARSRRHEAIGPEHLLLGRLTDDGSAAGRILRAAGAEFETLCRMGFLVPGGERGFFLATSPWLARP
jgi:ATP-dependent Clp protease ATP-binding subunit ClpC